MAAAPIPAIDACHRTFANSYIIVPDAPASAFALEPSSFIRIRAPRRRLRAPRAQVRGRAQVNANPWQRQAGNLAVLGDLAAQGARAARSHDARALDALLDRIRVTILDAIALSDTNDEFLVR